MDIIDLLQRSARIVWQKKHLMVLGTLFVIVTEGVPIQDMLIGPLIKPLFALFEIPGVAQLPLDNYDWLGQLLTWVEMHGTAGWASLVMGTVLLGILVGVIAIVTRGALIASAGEVDSMFGLGAALKVGWRKAWRLIIIASIPPIPVTIAAILIVVLATVVIKQAGGVDVVSSSVELQQQIGGGLLITSLIIMFPCYIATFILGLLSTLADRACVLEDRGVLESYQRGRKLFRANMGSAALLALLHLILSTMIGSALVVPGMLSMFCFAVMPLLWIVKGIEKTFLVTMWTLAWRAWVTLPAP